MNRLNLRRTIAFFMLLSVTSTLRSEEIAESLDEYLTKSGTFLGRMEGHITESQEEIFNQFLKENPQIESILEIGLNAGHSAENFFQNCINLQKFVSFDIGEHPYTDVAVRYLTMKYPNRFQFIKGNSRVTVPAYAKSTSAEVFDLIYIDGGHTADQAFNDIRNCRALAHTNTILWIDDYNGEVKRAVDKAVIRHLIVIDHIYQTIDRQWVQARYID